MKTPERNRYVIFRFNREFNQWDWYSYHAKRKLARLELRNLKQFFFNNKWKMVTFKA